MRIVNVNVFKPKNALSHLPEFYMFHMSFYICLSTYGVLSQDVG